MPTVFEYFQIVFEDELRSRFPPPTLGTEIPERRFRFLRPTGLRFRGPMAPKNGTVLGAGKRDHFEGHPHQWQREVVPNFGPQNGLTFYSFFNILVSPFVNFRSGQAQLLR